MTEPIIPTTFAIANNQVIAYFYAVLEAICLLNTKYHEVIKEPISNEILLSRHLNSDLNIIKVLQVFMNDIK